MTISSMTGFARATGEYNGAHWQWEVKSVNGRNLDLRMRLAPGFDDLEARIREIAAAKLQRGSVSLTLHYQPAPAERTIIVNDSLLAELVSAARRVQEGFDLEPARLDSLLTIKGVCEIAPATEDESQQELRRAAILQSLDEALEELLQHRNAEGEKIVLALEDQIASIDETVRRAKKAQEGTPAAIAGRLRERLADILNGERRIDPDRLEQEVALLAAKADPREEIDRLAAHVDACRDLLSQKQGAVGRRLDFLAQEMMREANTLCAKAASGELTQAGLSLKSQIDQFREQIQNIE